MERRDATDQSFSPYTKRTGILMSSIREAIGSLPTAPGAKRETMQYLAREGERTRSG